MLCEKSEVILLVLASGSYGRQSDKILVDLKISTGRTIRIFSVHDEETTLSRFNVFWLVFQVRCIVGHEKWEIMFFRINPYY